MFQRRYQQYECDECHKLIPKSHPVRFHNGKHFCRQECWRAYLDKEEEDRRWQEAADHVAIMGDD